MARYHQTGFKKGRDLENQLVRLAQAVTYGFQERHIYVMALLDFSKACDTVWR